MDQLQQVKKMGIKASWYDDQRTYHEQEYPSIKEAGQEWGLSMEAVKKRLECVFNIMSNKYPTALRFDLLDPMITSHKEHSKLVYVCLACHSEFSGSSIYIHLNSVKHQFNVSHECQKLDIPIMTLQERKILRGKRRALLADPTHVETTESLKNLKGIISSVHYETAPRALPPYAPSPTPPPPPQPDQFPPTNPQQFTTFMTIT